MALLERENDLHHRAWPYLAIAGAILLIHAFVLHLMGRIPWCTCGFSLWTSHAWSSDTSQDLADPYSFTHVIHGLFFYWLLRRVLRHRPVLHRLIVAMLLEVGWELLENSPIIINRYRGATASLNYVGDSILNSVGDVLSCVVGFWLALVLPVRASIALIVIIELVLLITIRDNLTLNIVMLVHPINAIKVWQSSH